MSALKFSTQVNPLGTLFHPLAIAQALRYAAKLAEWSIQDLQQANGQYFSWDHTTRFSGQERIFVEQKIQRTHEDLKNHFNAIDAVFITFGTALVFKETRTQRIVANCHKQPANAFTRAALSVQEIVEVYVDLLPQLFEQQPDLKLIFTVSPIRHWRSGVVENQQSKATLILAVHEIIATLKAQYPKQISYFPAYELMLDDLRDYRFYGADLQHPNSLAVQYIWEKFATAYLNSKTLEQLPEFEKLKKAVNHQIDTPLTPDQRAFVATQLKKIEALDKRFPHLNFSTERQHFEAYLTT